MDLTLSDEQRLLRESADRFVSETYTADHRRKVASDPLGFSTEIWKQFADLGWLALPIAEAHGARRRRHRDRYPDGSVRARTRL
jgi:alkylation response protein AidB-like acyl-CoA dehydrogenase